MNSGRKPINEQTRIKLLLEANQAEVINALVKLNKNFSKLKNPVLRNLFASRITIADACKIANCSVSDFLNSMKQIGFEINSAHDQIVIPTENINNQINCETAELDVRPILAQNQDPLKVILNKVKSLKEGQGLKLINTFEPIPLIHLLAEKGFSHFTEFTDTDTVVTSFYRDKIINSPDPKSSEKKGDTEGLFNEALSKFAPAKIKYIDVRELEMPKPMHLILENIERLNDDDLLFVYHKKRPIFLLPELERRGFNYHFMDIPDGDVNMLIYRDELN